MESLLLNIIRHVISDHPHGVLAVDTSGDICLFSSEKKESAFEPWVTWKQQKIFRIIGKWREKFQEPWQVIGPLLQWYRFDPHSYQ